MNATVICNETATSQSTLLTAVRDVMSVTDIIIKLRISIFSTTFHS